MLTELAEVSSERIILRSVFIRLVSYILVPGGCDIRFGNAPYTCPVLASCNKDSLKIAFSYSDVRAVRFRSVQQQSRVHLPARSRSTRASASHSYC